MKLRFLFQYEEKADYSGMAAAYRQYLLEQGKLSKAEDDKKQMHINFIGSVKYDDTVLGIRLRQTRRSLHTARQKKFLRPYRKRVQQMYPLDTADGQMTAMKIQYTTRQSSFPPLAEKKGFLI